MQKKAHRDKSIQLNCFSPPVMLATFFIEIALGIWTLWRYKRSTLTMLVAVMLFCLAVFQLAEYNICAERFGLSNLTWARIGYVAITALPALGIHALFVITRQRQTGLLAAAYLAMASFMVYFLFVGHGIAQTSCGGNYVIFQTNPLATHWYTLYYYGLELFALLRAYLLGRRAKEKRQKEALYGLTGAYLVLIVPVVFVTTIRPSLASAIPSIMCGFAIFLALIITLYVLPRAAEKR